MSKQHKKSIYEINCENLYESIKYRTIEFGSSLNKKEIIIFKNTLLKDWRYFKKYARVKNYKLDEYKYKPKYDIKNLNSYDNEFGNKVYILLEKEYKNIENYVVASDRLFWKLYKEYQLTLKNEKKVNKKQQELDFKKYYFKNDDEWETIIYLVLSCNESKELLKDIERLELYRIRNYGDYMFDSIKLKINNLENNVRIIEDNVYIVEFKISELNLLDDIYFKNLKGIMEIKNIVRFNKKRNKLTNIINEKDIIKKIDNVEKIIIENDFYVDEWINSNEFYPNDTRDNLLNYGRSILVNNYKRPIQKLELDLTFKLDYVIVMDKENYTMSMEDNTNRMRRKTPLIEVLSGKSRYVRYDCKKILSSYRKLVNWKIREENYRKC